MLEIIEATDAPAGPTGPTGWMDDAACEGKSDFFFAPFAALGRPER